MDFRLTSEAFEDNGTIPIRYTCHGDNVSPPLSWTEPPQGTRSLVLLAVDLDTPFGVIAHWIVYNIPVERRELPAAIATADIDGAGMAQGRNGMFQRSYMGPCPPWGRHRYVFTLYALDGPLDGVRIPTRRSLVKAIDGKVIASAQLTGLFARSDAKHGPA